MTAPRMFCSYGDTTTARPRRGSTVCEAGSDGLARRFRPFKAPPGFEHAGDRPGLRRTAARGVWWVPVEDLADLAEPGIGQVVADRFEKTLRRRGVAIHAIMSKRPRAQQPSPYRTLVIGAVAGADGPAATAAIRRLTRGQ